METETKTDAYRMAEQPTSPGRAFLARAFAHWCALHFGASPEEVAAALDGDPSVDGSVRAQVAGATRLMGEVLAAGQMRAWVRPLGGGQPIKMPAELWELDDFRPRLAASAVSFERPFDREAAPSHWIFVELDDFNAVVEASCADILEKAAGTEAPRGRVDRPPAPETPPPLTKAQDERTRAERYLRLPEVKRRTGMSRTTLYERIKAGRFPAQVEMEGNIAAWRESEVDRWLANPR